MGKATEPPKCKVCGKAHFGTCADHDARGAINAQVGPRRPGRPKTVPDRKAYKAAKQREYREKKKGETK